jgi:fucose 4-O-acetylase-like acetyltransferase
MEKTYRYKKHCRTIKLPIFIFIIIILRYWVICNHSDIAEFLRKKLALPRQESPMTSVLLFLAFLFGGILILRFLSQVVIQIHSNKRSGNCI